MTRRALAIRPRAVAGSCAAATLALALALGLPRAGAAADAAELARVLALPDDPAYGAYLAGTCAGCHAARSDGAGAIPALRGLSAERVARALLEYRDGTRADPAMGAISSSLGEREIAALARHLERARDRAR